MVKYCQVYQCLPEDFTTKVLWHCMRRLQSPFARLIWLFNEDFFQSDLELINQVKDATSYAKIRETIKFFSKEPASTNFVRRSLKIRISRSKLLGLAAAALGDHSGKSEAEPPA